MLAAAAAAAAAVVAAAAAAVSAEEGSQQIAMLTDSAGSYQPHLVHPEQSQKQRTVSAVVDWRHRYMLWEQQFVAEKKEDLEPGLPSQKNCAGVKVVNCITQKKWEELQLDTAGWKL